MPTNGVQEAPSGRVAQLDRVSASDAGTQSTADTRFWTKVAKADGCWDWTGAVTSAGYGSFGAVTYPKVRMVSAHKWAWERAHGPVPEGMVLMHSCDNRKCVNLAHLSLGTVADNNRDMVAKGRHARKRGVAFDGACSRCRRRGHNARTCEVGS